MSNSSTKYARRGARSGATGGLPASALSPDAKRLLDYLWDADATGAEMAVTQDVVARDLGLPRRQIPDLTRELLEAASRDLSATRGYAPVCRCHPPYGLFLSANPKDLHDYDVQLRHRGIATLVRRRTLRRVARALRESAASHPPGVLPDGQMVFTLSERPQSRSRVEGLIGAAP